MICTALIHDADGKYTATYENHNGSGISIAIYFASGNPMTALWWPASHAYPAALTADEMANATPEPQKS